MVSVIVVAVVISVIVRNLIGNSRASFLLDKVLSYITASSAKLSNQVLFSDILCVVPLLVHVNFGGGDGGAGSGCNWVELPWEMFLNS